MNIEEMYTTHEAARLMNKSSSWVRVLCERGEGGFPGARKKGRIWLIPKEDVESYIREGRRPGNPYFGIIAYTQKCKDNHS